MFFIPGVLFFIFGVIMGSFLNVVILRYNTGKSLQGRSACASCNKKLEPHELVPLVSYLFLGGKCSRCKSKISMQYPLVEFFTGCLFFLAFYKIFIVSGLSVSFSFGLHPVWFLWSILYLVTQFCLLIIIFVYDLKHKIIPDGPVYTFIVLAFIEFFVTYQFSTFHFPVLWNFLAGPIFFSLFFLIWFISKGRAMGFGDAKLVLGIGLFLGLAEGISAIILSFWIGAIVSISLIFSQQIAGNKKRKTQLKSAERELTMKSEIPFAPFLIAGIITAYIFNFDILSLHILLGI